LSQKNTLAYFKAPLVTKKNTIKLQVHHSACLGGGLYSTYL
jgi:hypothetical protein